ncbi:hypothetical protein CG471_21775 [Sphingobium sp. IP1]|uniref:hypothetical protein n=1 Tax=Sphingobium sp. IP1 TaxID=2021637 RepID=UPI000C07767B|nr:hypothetical protein [Sphingobium sp. IP1]PHP17654.1 hypothetical protein CG471_21775 [Sphingobium sp. IP1]
MAITDLISGIGAAINETREKLTEIDTEISKLNAERLRIVQAPPHTDDIVAAYMRGLDAAKSSFESRLAWNLNDRNAREPEAAAQVERGTGQLVTIYQTPPMTGGLHSSPSKSLLTNAGLGERQATVDAAALVYFLSDHIAAEIPKLVAKLCPSAKNGMRQEDRDRMLAEVDSRLAALKQEQAELQSHLEAARKAVRPH